MLTNKNIVNEGKFGKGKENYVALFLTPIYENMATDYAVVVKDLKKSFKNLQVLRGISFSVARGTVLAILGPNGAGKTTTVRILSTLITPDEGIAIVNGFDVQKHPKQVRSNIGLTGQFAAVDEYLTATENLYMLGRLYRMSHAVIKERSKELLEKFDLVDAAHRSVKNYSGGMKRRIDLAMSLIASPPVIFLDEPTTGLDPRSRLAMWEMIRQLKAEGTSILLTTQYMDEADQLADRIVVIDNGLVIAEGTADELKARVGSDRVELKLAKEDDIEKAHALMNGESVHTNTDRRIISVTTKGGITRLKEILQRFESAGLEVENVSLNRPTLDDVFLALTGHAATEETEADQHKK
ncbi:ATP-binding cassette domain-containing protein [Olivibacter domesticus]|uniref:ABC-2 type transport system ATP-binding protein n=1 Tax=Olivibacter domesticus TaxID=407022 RepID=A0A1H7UEX0_OLID1|nr:ATP-binding cassette domain-containing protein [Olivibacter domesticus]SEL95573.1 ABC-2 type transport system ATP-binding protein [Olivibacter domesticus]